MSQPAARASRSTTPVPQLPSSSVRWTPWAVLPTWQSRAPWRTLPISRLRSASLTWAAARHRRPLRSHRRAARHRRRLPRPYQPRYLHRHRRSLRPGPQPSRLRQQQHVPGRRQVPRRVLAHRRGLRLGPRCGHPLGLIRQRRHRQTPVPPPGLRRGHELKHQPPTATHRDLDADANEPHANVDGDHRPDLDGYTPADLDADLTPSATATASSE